MLNYQRVVEDIFKTEMGLKILNLSMFDVFYLSPVMSMFGFWKAQQKVADGPGNLGQASRSS
jgi:hypothetical protein